jgi:predicted helicase
LRSPWTPLSPRSSTLTALPTAGRFADYKEKAIDLLKRVTTVSVETMEVVRGMETMKR